MTNNTLRALIVGSLTATAMFTAGTANAAIPVIDPTAIARIREVVSTASKQLAEVQKQVTQVTQMRNTIGQVGRGQLGSILSQTGLDFSGANGVLRDVRTLGNRANNIGYQLNTMTIDGEGASLNLPQIRSLVDGREAASKIFFVPNSVDVSVNTVKQLRERRNAAVRDAAVTGYGAAASFKADLSETQQIADKLSAQARESADLRTDVQVNTATLLAIYGEIQKQTAIQAQMLELDAARSLAADVTAKRN